MCKRRHYPLLLVNFDITYGYKLYLYVFLTIVQTAILTGVNRLFLELISFKEKE